MCGPVEKTIKILFHWNNMPKKWTSDTYQEMLLHNRRTILFNV